MRIFELIVSAVAGLVGLVFLVLGWLTVEAGKGGYGMGPIPMLKVPRDDGLILLGLTGVLIGSFILAAVWMVVMP